MIATIKDYADRLFCQTVNRNIAHITEFDQEGISPKASTIAKYYAEYPYIVCWAAEKQYSHITVGSKLAKTTDWCKENGIEFATGIHEVIWTDSYSGNYEWAINNIAGEERWFWAFKTEQDSIMFSLRWY